MQSKFAALTVGLVAITTAGCSKSSNASEALPEAHSARDSGGPVADTADATDAPIANDGPTVMVHGSVVSFPGFAPLSDFDVCLHKASPARCQKTDGSGQFTLPVPANANVAVTFVRDGFLSILVAVRTGSDDIDIEPTAFTAQLTDADRLYTAMGFTRDPAKGLVDIALPGADLTFTPKSGAGPFVGSTMGLGLTDITGPLAGVPLTVFANIDPGEVEFRAISPAGPCVFSDLLWQGSTPGTVRLPILAGFNTRLIAVTCSASSPADGGKG
jgi:hypothetical protein